MRCRALVAAISVAAAACSASGDDAGAPISAEFTAVTAAVSPATTAATTTSAAAPTSTTAGTTPAIRVTTGFAGRGPNPVGFRTLDLGGRPVDLWYPSAAGATGPAFVIDPTVTLPPALASLASALPPYLSAKTSTAATVDVPAAAGPFPLVIYSHGFGGWRREAAATLEHLASWGYVVAAVEHVERNQTAAFAGTINPAAVRDVADISATIDAVLADAAIGPSSDPARIAAMGFSAGGRAAFASVDTEPRLGMVIGIAPAVTAAPSRVVPSLILHGSNDSVIPLAGVQQLSAALTPPSRLVTAAGAGHASWADICGNIWDAGGLDPVVKSFLGGGQGASLLSSAENGCLPADPDPRLVVDLAKLTTVAFLRSNWGDPAAAGELEQAALASRFGPLAPTVQTR